MAYVEFDVNGYKILWSIMSNCIYFLIITMSAGRSAQTYEKQSVLSSCGSFRKKFGKVRLWLIQDFIEIIRVSFVVACSIALLFSFMIKFEREECSHDHFFTYFWPLSTVLLCILCIFWSIFFILISDCGRPGRVHKLFCF